VYVFCSTSWKVAGSIPDGDIEIFVDIILPFVAMVLGSTQPLTVTSAINISWG
jgi:hypothetical protein